MDDGLTTNKIIEDMTHSVSEVPKILEPQMQDAWNILALSYDKVSTISFAHMAKNHQIAKIIMGLPNDRIVNLGCGSGVLEKSLFNLGFSGQMVSLDNSAAMLRIAREKIGQCPNISFNLFNLNHKLPFESNFFNCATAINIIFFLNQPLRFLSEVYRILKPGGYLLLVNPKPEGNIISFFKAQVNDRSIMPFIKELFRNLLGIGHIFRVIAFQKKLDKMHKDDMIHYSDDDELKSIVKSAGFSIEEFSEIQAGQNWLIKAVRY